MRHSKGGRTTRAFEWEVTATSRILEGAAIEELPLTMAFWITAHDPYDYALQKGNTTLLFFVRSADGDFHVPDSSSDSPGEWLSSYYTHRRDEHSDSERERFARLAPRSCTRPSSTRRSRMSRG